MAGNSLSYYMNDAINAENLGAAGDGATDSTAAIQAALNAASFGSTVYLPAGTYAVSAPLMIPPGVRLAGSQSSHIDATPVSIKPLATWSSNGYPASAVLLMVDQATGGYPVPSALQAVTGITVDCSNITAQTTVDGLQALGFVHSVFLQDIQFIKPPNHGVFTVTNSSGNPYSWRAERVNVTNGGKFGFSVAITDSTWIDCEAIGCANNGWNLAGSPANSHFIGCRGEWCLNGLSLSGTWVTGQGSGGCTFTDFSTDRNVQNGVVISVTSGNMPVLFEGLMCRRDGANSGSGGGSFAAVSIGATTIPVILNGLTVFPGVNDDGTGTNSPQFGVSITGVPTYVSLTNAFLHAATTGQSGVSTGNNCTWRALATRTGTTSSPSAITLVADSA